MSLRYKMVAIDLDDTLLLPDLSISPRAQSAISRLTALGTHVILTTGRMYVAAMPYWRQLKLFEPLISYQGASVVNPITDEVMWSVCVPLPLAREVLQFARDENTHVQWYSGNEYYYAQANRFSEFYAKTANVEGALADLDELAADGQPDPIKLICIGDPPDILNLSPRAQAVFGDRLAISISKPQYLEFTHPAADKGKAVRFLAEHWNIPREQIVAMGDGFNDVPMMQYAGLGIAMGNAHPDVQAQADVVALPNGEDGAAIALERYVLDGQS